ncbi:Transcription initiation factor TFIID subunit [Lachnellula occidentalis]|uniref:Transcription initiation factor TFIID subunit n=1 Tax=Lachnellula occidentalis TaxID=215460 RepID=A0A8H8UD03_9HELO|nr:Transcription initiation factor TFIID subunit [Lachnellula occidentalis]
MNTGGGGGLAPQQPASGEQRRPNIPMFKPEQMRSLPDAFSSDKEKWENGLRSLWNQLQSHGPETQQHQEAKRKIFEFSKTLTAKMQNYRQQQQQAQQGGGAGVGVGSGGSGPPRPVSQGQPQAGQAGENSAPKPNPEQVQQPALQQQAKPQPRVSAKVMEHVAKFPYIVPANVNPNSPDALKWIAEAKNRYLKGLVSMENASARLTQMDTMVQKRMNEGKPLNPEEEKDYKEKKETFQKAHSEAKSFVDTFRLQQTQAKTARDARDATNGGQGSPTQPPQIGGALANNGQAVRPQMNPQQQPQNPALQNTQTVNAAIEAARNQQMGGARPQLPQNGQPAQPGQMPNPTAPSMPHQPAGQNTNLNPNIKLEAGVPPPINTAISQMQQRPNLNSPQSAVPQSAGPPQSATSQAQQIPRALTHSAALSQAARSYSNGAPQSSSQPHVMGHSHPSTQRETQNIVTNKMPIPKYLDERSAAPPQPVAINQSRPTFSGGPSNSGSGVMAQPVLPKTPGFNMASDDNRVLSRKKLDELVKQVTGGGQGDGPSLMPEVEESMLTVADSFVDQVLHNACKMAKERGSKVLEIRDIQLTLERNYNIRIPGYASDEIRTVRKIQPAPAWIAKMSAVQAAKVTGGKNSD